VVVLEKAALAGIVDPVCKDLDTPLLAARGYSSATLFFEIAKERICPALEDGQEVVVLHLGDHDPSGLDMTRDLQDRLSLYAANGPRVRRPSSKVRLACVSSWVLGRVRRERKCRGCEAARQ
jgi:hypothetical protein